MKPKTISPIIVCIAYILFNPAILFAQTRTPTYGTDRRPRTCPPELHKTKGKLTAAQAKMFFICDTEYEFTNNQSLIFVNDLDLKIATKSRRANGADLKFSHGHGGVPLSMDFDKPVYDIKASYTNYTCFGASYYEVGKNCDINYYSGAGICFKDSFDEWHCRTISSSTQKPKYKVSPPSS